MTQVATLDAYGELIEPTTLKIERLLPGPIERCWDYLTRSELRRQWLAAGDMELVVGAPFELVWRNDELTDPPGQRPEGFDVEHRMQSHVIEVEPPHRLSFAWRDGEVTFTLERRGEQVLLTVFHRGISDRNNMLMIGAGWHTHLDVLAAITRAEVPAPFWDQWASLRAEYDQLLP